MQTQSRRDARPKGDVKKIYHFNEQISRCHDAIRALALKRESRGTTLEPIDSVTLENLQYQQNWLQMSRHDELTRVYSKANVYRRPTTAPKLPYIAPKKSIGTMKISNIKLTPTSAEIEMQLETNTTDQTVRNEGPTIKYPPNCKDRQPYDTVARYRQFMKKINSIDFVEEPIRVGTQEAETMVIGMDRIAKNMGCGLIFTNEDETLDNSLYHAASGMQDIGNIHVLSSDEKQTAVLALVMDVNFKEKFQQSKEKIAKFVMELRAEIIKILECDPNSVRIPRINAISTSTSGSSMQKENKKSEIIVCYTCPHIERTKHDIQKFQTLACHGFKRNTILDRINPGFYKIQWGSVVQALKLNVSLFDPAGDRNYVEPEFHKGDKLIRGGKDYHIPFGYTRLGLNVKDKYETERNWLSANEDDKPWNVAFLGPKFSVAQSIVSENFKLGFGHSEAMRLSAVRQRGPTFNRPGFYVATKCEGGASLYATEFEVPINANKTEKFQLVFQCRVKPGEYTVHQSTVKDVHIWRFIDPAHIRPYGILLKKKN